MKRVATAVTMLLSAYLLAGCNQPAGPSNQTKVNKPEPAAALPNDKVEMAVVKYDDLAKTKIPAYKGKVVVMDMWGTWCGPCKENFHHLVELQHKYEGKDLQCVSLCLPQNDGDVKDQPKARAFLEKEKSVLPNYWLQDGWEPIQKAISFQSLPTVVVFGRDGAVAKIFTGKVEYDDIETFAKGLLKDPK